jgi:hypothetical protein
MYELVGKCGCICEICPLYKENLLTDEDKKNASIGCGKYLNWNPTPEKLKKCWGCQSDEGFKYLPKCNMRMCAFHNEVENCAYCSSFPCEDTQRFSRELVETRLGESVPEEDYLKFIKPWEGAKNLEEIRNTLSENDIIEMRPKSANLRIVKFPEELNCSKKQKTAFRTLYEIIQKIEPLKNLSYARLEVRKEVRKYLIKLLQSFGTNGKLVKDQDKEYLEIDSETYFKDMKGIRFYSSLEGVGHRLEIFENNGINIELFPEKSLDDIITPTKALRKKGWKMRLSYGEEKLKLTNVKTLQEYAKKLNEEYGKKSYTYFSKADMRILA